MEDILLVADVGRITGSASTRRLRAEGKVPAVLYGHGVEPQSLAVDGKALRVALHQEAGLNALISLDVDGQRHLAMARQLQRDAIRRTVSHVDFVIVRRDEVVTVEVPLRLIGEALKVERADGLVEQQVFSLSVNAKPADIPPAVEVDISDLVIGDAIRVGDISLPPGVTTDLDDDEQLVMAQASHTAEEVEQADVEAEAAAAVPEGAAEPGEVPDVADGAEE